MSDLECKTCDTNIAEPTPPKVIVVTEMSGRERRFPADGFNHGLLGVTVKRGEKTIAYYPAGTFLGVREEGAAANDGPADKRKLAIALKGLEGIEDHVDDTENREWADLRIMVGDIFAEIADVDL